MWILGVTITDNGLFTIGVVRDPLAAVRSHVADAGGGAAGAVPAAVGRHFAKIDEICPPPWRQIDPIRGM